MLCGGTWLRTIVTWKVEMKYKRIAERWVPGQDHVAVIESAVEDIAPDGGGLQTWYKRYSEGQKKRLAFDLDYVQRFATHGDVMLEFGSTPPILTLALTRLGYSVCGLDLAPDRFQSVVRRERLTVRKVNFETDSLPFSDSTVDLVIFNEVFEHLRINPIFTFSEVSRVLKMQGKLFLTTPNLVSWKNWYSFVIQNRLPMDMYDAYDLLEKVGHMGHVRIYSPREVATFLEKMGFAVELIIHRQCWQSPSPRVRAVEDLLLRLLPRLRTHFSVVAKKIGHARAPRAFSGAE